MAIDNVDPVRSAGPKAALVLEELARQRRRSLVVGRDRDWLREISSNPYLLLARMEDAKLLYRISRGRYVVAPRGTFTPLQAAPVELMIDLVLGAQGDYYLGFLSALIGHRLTDLHSSTEYAAIRSSSSYSKVEVDLPGAMLHVVRLSDTRWPVMEAGESRELERVRVLAETTEFVWRATLERALVDALARPDLSGGIETVVESWVRAKGERTDWDAVCVIARRYGPSMLRRSAFLLRLLGLGSVAERNFADLSGRGASTPFDRSTGFDLARAETVRDRQTGVVVNVPAEHLLRWTGATSLS